MKGKYSYMIQTFFLGGAEGPFLPAKNMVVTLVGWEMFRTSVKEKGPKDSPPESYWCVLRREFSGMIHFITINNNPSNPQQPIQQPYV